MIVLFQQLLCRKPDASAVDLIICLSVVEETGFLLNSFVSHTPFLLKFPLTWILVWGQTESLQSACCWIWAMWWRWSAAVCSETLVWGWSVAVEAAVEHFCTVWDRNWGEGRKSRYELWVGGCGVLMLLLSAQFVKVYLYLIISYLTYLSLLNILTLTTEAESVEWGTAAQQATKNKTLANRHRYENRHK